MSNDFPYESFAACTWPTGNSDTDGLQSCCNGSEIISYRNGYGQNCTVGQSYAAALGYLNELPTPNPLIVCVGLSSGVRSLLALDHVRGLTCLMLVVVLSWDLCDTSYAVDEVQSRYVGNNAVGGIRGHQQYIPSRHLASPSYKLPSRLINCI